jgi:hypothetical protein
MPIECLSIPGKLSQSLFSCHLKRGARSVYRDAVVAQILAYTIQITSLFNKPCSITGVTVHVALHTRNFMQNSYNKTSYNKTSAQSVNVFGYLGLETTGSEVYAFHLRKNCTKVGQACLLSLIKTCF